MPIKLALVGRTNVGKSTLFNYLTGSKAALTGNTAGLTRDRREGYFQRQQKSYHLIDTGGLVDTSEDILASLIRQQVDHAIETADYVIFVADAREGLVHQDEKIASFLRKCNKPVLGIINKAEGQLAQSTAIAEFGSLGFSFHAVSALQGRGFSDFFDQLSTFPQKQVTPTSVPAFTTSRDTALKIAVIGRPNAGKSTLINHLIGEERQIVSEEAGTTRDSIEINFYYRNHAYTLVDTAGMRRLANVQPGLEAAAVKQSLQSLRGSVVVLFVMDAALGFTDQDLRLLERITEAGRAVVVLCNKWDSLDEESKATFQIECKRRLRFAPFIKVGFVSGLHNIGLSKILPLVKDAYTHATKKLSTSQLTRLLEQALYEHSPPRNIKLRYAHPGGYNPPIIVIHGTHVQDIPVAYKRYLHNFYQKQLKIVNTPIKIEFREKQSKR